MLNVGRESRLEEGKKGEGGRLESHEQGRVSGIGEASRRLNCVERAGKKGTKSGKDRKWL